MVYTGIQMQTRGLRSPIRLAGASLLRLQSDARLVDLARDGHDPAFAAIVDRHRPALLRYATRLLGRERAEDAVQHALLKAFTALRDSETETEIDVRPWLYRIVHNTALNVLRTTRDEAQLDELAASGDGPHEIAERQERLRRTLAAVEALPAHQRDAIVLRELEGRSHDEIAAALGVSVGAARQHLHRARSTLRTAVTAVTPYGLIVRVIEGASDGRISEIAAGAGIGASVTKMGIAALATTTLVGGVVTSQHVVSGRADGAKAGPAALHGHSGSTATASGQAAAATPGATVAGSAGQAGGPATDDGHRRRGGSGAGGRDGHKGSGHGADDNGAGEHGRGGGGPGRSAFGDDMRRPVSGGREPGDDQRSGSGSGKSGRGSGDDGRHSGSGSSGGGSGDDGHSGRSDRGSGSGKGGRGSGDHGGSGIPAGDQPSGTSGSSPADDGGSGSGGSTPEPAVPDTSGHGSGEDDHPTETTASDDVPPPVTDPAAAPRDALAVVPPPAG
jgi:RNA polymerase sigma factor (sigma-70 family)